MNDLRSTASFNPIERARGSRWLAMLFATIMIVAGSFAGCVDVGIDDPSCGTCPPPAARFDTSTSFDLRPDTIYHAGDLFTIVYTTYYDTVFTNRSTRDEHHRYDTIISRSEVQKREPIREATISVKDKRGDLKTVKIKLRSNPLEIATDDKNLPGRISFEGFVAIGPSFNNVDFERQLGTLHISLPETTFVRQYKLSAHPEFGPGAWLEVDGRKVITGDNSGSQRSDAYLLVGSTANYRQRIMELTFEGVFHNPGPNPSDPINVRVVFRLSY